MHIFLNNGIIIFGKEALMITLFIDTHFKDVQIAVYKNNNVLKISRIENCDKTSKNVLPLLRKTFTELNIDLKKISKIIVCNGPGSFTGIRIAVTISKVLSYCLNIPIYTVNYLELSALNNIGLNTFIVRENNGYYKADFLDDKMIGKITYIKSKELLENEIINNDIDFQKIPDYKYLKKSDCYNANPLYIKSIEALNDKKNVSN